MEKLTQEEIDSLKVEDYVYMLTKFIKFIEYKLIYKCNDYSVFVHKNFNGYDYGLNLLDSDVPLVRIEKELSYILYKDTDESN